MPINFHCAVRAYAVVYLLPIVKETLEFVGLEGDRATNSIILSRTR